MDRHSAAEVKVIFKRGEAGRVFWKAELSTFALENKWGPALPTVCT